MRGRYLLCWGMVAMFCPNAAAQRQTAAQLVEAPRVLIIAHRGNSSQAPENTLPAFRSAVEAGADLVELDYYHSADGVPVVFHDKTLKRTTNAAAVFGQPELPLASMTWAQLQRLDAGAWFAESWAGTPIPSLEAALEVIQPGSYTLIERKDGDAQTCVRLLERKGLLHQVVVQSFDWSFVTECHRLAPQLTLAALGSKELTSAKLDQIAATGSRIVAWDHKEIGPEQIAAIHARGWRAWVYTVDDPQRARELIAGGIDGIITNVPTQLLPLVSDAPQPDPRTGG